MNNFSCSLSCTRMTIIDCLWYASDSLSRDVSWEVIAKLLVAWLYSYHGNTEWGSFFNPYKPSILFVGQGQIVQSLFTIYRKVLGYFKWS